MRLNRYLSVAGFASRRKGETVIRAGRVSVNGEVVTDPARNVEPDEDTVVADGTKLTVSERKRWYILNKPAGCIVSRGDTHGRATVYDLLGPETAGVFAVGRLDFDTTGVLIFTDDGDVAHRLMHPSYGVEKVYRAEVKGRIGIREVRMFHRGIKLDDGMTSPSALRIVGNDGGTSIADVTLHEGRKRQVRRMFDAVGNSVIALERLSFGGVTAKGLNCGSYRVLIDDEINDLRKQAGLTKMENGK